MFDLSPTLYLKSGEQIQTHISVEKKTGNGGVTSVYVDAMAMARDPINSELGVRIAVTPNFKVKRYMANYRHCEFWCRVFFGSSLQNIPDQTQNLILELEDGRFVAVVPVVNDTYKCVLEGLDEDRFSAKLFSWYDGLYTCRGLSFVYAVGKNPYRLVESCVKEALRLLNNGTRHRSQRRYPDIFEYLGWCSWDSMQIRVSEEGVLRKCEEFKSKNIPVKWAILDDMWAEIRDFYGREYHEFIEMIHIMHASAMYHFEADPIRFPNGLAACISKMKEYGLQVGMWMPTTGYWRGIEPNSPAHNALKDYLIELDNGYLVPDWRSEKAYRYFKTFHDFFCKCGATFVKTDNQSMIMTYYKNLAPVGKIAKEYHDGLEASAGEHFDNAMINCMGTASEDIWNRSVSPISRCSGDFKPENKAWFTQHILQCAYTSILQGQFYWCDWDMWWTDDGQGPKNSLMRAISGGPIYVSDKIGRSKKELLMPLCLESGKILRCDRPAVPTFDCITVDPATSGKAMKLQNTVGAYGVMAVVNLDAEEKPVTATISGRQIDGFAAQEYVVYDHFRKEIKILKNNESFEVTLSSPDDYKLFIFAPLHNGFAAIGRTDKFISPKTIRYVHKEDIVLEEDGPYAYVKDGKLVLKSK